MRARLVIAILLTIPLIARANPVMIDGQSLIAFGIVAFWALVIESGDQDSSFSCLKRRLGAVAFSGVKHLTGSALKFKVSGQATWRRVWPE
jgi:hypothetical protein